MHKHNNYIFLLGGHDLEMIEIKAILVQHNISFYDHNLKWDNASWTSYTSYFDQPEHTEKTFVGIELFDKKQRPKNSIDIDHHNENQFEKSAIEQVIDLLDLPEAFDRRRQLVAANDKGYIPAMQQMGASTSEITIIRRDDRKAQGVTKTDEQNAKTSIATKQQEINGITLIYSLTDRFSIINDFLFGKTNQLLVYNESALNYYGDTTSLVQLYEKEIPNGSAYYGGNTANGYFGLAAGHWSSNEIRREIPRIIQTITHFKNSAYGQ